MIRLQKQVNSNKMSRYLLLVCSVLWLVSCTRIESVLEETSSSSTTKIKTSTAVKINVINGNNEPQSGIVVMMFKSKVKADAPLPTVEKEVVSDINGVANFDLSSYIQEDTEQIYYFEAFRKQGDKYLLVSTTHPEFKIKKNTIKTTAIIIKQ
ncbi:hypothetical protein JZ969_09535 [Riemerella anatipestifer]